jgi:Domain of unknown function (DUF4419)
LRACNSAGQNGSDDFETISGWITAFCSCTEEGGRLVGVELEYLKRCETPIADHKELCLAGVKFPVIRSKQIPVSILSVLATINDLETGLEHATTMIAGSVAMTATTVGD